MRCRALLKRMGKSRGGDMSNLTTAKAIQKHIMVLTRPAKKIDAFSAWKKETGPMLDTISHVSKNSPMQSSNPRARNATRDNSK